MREDGFEPLMSRPMWPLLTFFAFLLGQQVMMFLYTVEEGGNPVLFGIGAVISIVLIVVYWRGQRRIDTRNERALRRAYDRYSHYVTGLDRRPTFEEWVDEHAAAQAERRW